MTKNNTFLLPEKNKISWNVSSWTVEENNQQETFFLNHLTVLDVSSWDCHPERKSAYKTSLFLWVNNTVLHGLHTFNEMCIFSENEYGKIIFKNSVMSSFKKCLSNN